MNRRPRQIIAATVGLSVLAATAACSTSSSAQRQSQRLTDDITNSATSAVPYPLDDMKKGAWTERRELNEHLKRQDNPKGLRWIVLLTQQGQPIASWPIQGMVFDPNSQLTTTQVLNSNGDGAQSTTQAAGDNGTWGPEAGSAAFFTTNGVEIQLPPSALWIESDAPIDITTKPVIVYNVNDKPNSDFGGWLGWRVLGPPAGEFWTR